MKMNKNELNRFMLISLKFNLTILKINFSIKIFSFLIYKDLNMY